MAKSALAQHTIPTLSILLVEDNPSDAFLVKSLLTEYATAQYDICHVKTQAEALEVLGNQTFDVCLLDMTLPDASGFSALIDIQEKTSGMPTLILTGVNDAAVAKRAVGRGAQDYLLKDELETAKLARAIDYARERKRIEKELFHRANYDALTGLVNRSLFETRLKRALARSERLGNNLAVLFLDLDRFKPINDMYGHEAGDEVLKTTSQRIQGVLRSYDTAARMGGDEFAILLENVDSPRDTAVIARKIIDSLSPAISYRTKTLTIGVSIGIAFCDTVQSSETLLQNADTAMYEAKEEGGNAYRFYVKNIHYGTQSRLRQEEELRRAVAEGHLKLYYQPYVTPHADAILGVEALLRWLHPERGLLFPAEFLPLAEECRLMPAMGEWMFCELQKDISAWNKCRIPPIEIAFNVCGSQLNASDFIQWIEPVADKSILGDHQLVAEIHSDAVATLSQPLFLTLVKLRELGIKTHIDHFGQGPVSLQTLHTYPFSLLKLNLASIEYMKDTHQGDAIIHTAIELAHQLGMKAGAVGIETPAQMHMLQSKHCDVMQGFFISEPMTGQQLPLWINSEAFGA